MVRLGERLAAGPVLRTGAVVVAALVAVGAVVFWLAGWPLGLDCAVYRAGALAVLHGSPLYGTLPFLPSWASGMPFTYPPLAALVFAPLAWLPPQLFWGVLAVASVLAVALVLTRAIGPIPLPRLIVVAVGAGSLALEPVWRGIGFGQLDAVLMAAVVLDVLVLPQSRWRGVLIGLAAAIKLTPLVFVLHLFLIGRRADALRALGAFAGLTALSLLVLPADSIRYWSTQVLGGPLFSANPATNSAQVADQSLNGLLERASGRASWAFPVAVGLGLVLLAVIVPVVRRLAARGARWEALLVSAGFGLLVSPVSWTHHWVWVVALAGLVARRYRWLAGVLVVFTGWFQLVVPHGGGAESRWGIGASIIGNAYVLTALITIMALRSITSVDTEISSNYLEAEVSCPGEKRSSEAPYPRRQVRGSPARTGRRGAVDPGRSRLRPHEPAHDRGEHRVLPWAAALLLRRQGRADHLLRAPLQGSLRAALRGRHGRRVHVRGAGHRLR